jgi:hypothetical protein
VWLNQKELQMTDSRNASANSMTNDTNRTEDPKANPDPITGAPGFHPVGTGVGAAGGGLGGAAAGAAIGSAVPGIGTVVGGVVGAVVGATGGGLAGKGIANPSAEDAYWRQNYKSRPYVSPDAPYDEYAPAYRYGWESRSQNANRRYEDVENDLARGGDKARANSRLGWEKAKNATRDAWEHAGRSTTRVTSRDDRDAL